MTATLAMGGRSHGRELALLRLALALGAILMLFASDARDLVRIWWTSSTYNHCMLVVPIIGWLVWQRLSELREIEPAPWLPGLLPVAAGGFGWLLGDVAGVAFARHLGLVMMLQGATITLLGRDMARGLAFPLAYAFVMVPFGETLVPLLQTVTAKIAMLLLALSGVPAHMEGVFITIPNGWFEVAEACSGVKFLIAMFAYGLLVANVCFLSWRRRAVFMAAALVLPVLANGIRAWGTIFYAHLTTARSAVGFDHVIYGWFFFGLVIALLMGGSWRFFDRPIESPWLRFTPTPIAGPRPRAWVQAGAGLAGLLALFLGWSAVAASGHGQLAPRIALPELPGWHPVKPEAVRWRPNFAGADRFLVGHYGTDGGRRADLAIAVYTSQAEGRELVGYGQGAIAPGSPWAWTDNRAAPTGGRAFRITGTGGVVREVLVFYRVGEMLTGSETRVKLETLKARLTGGRNCATAVLVSAYSRADADALLATLGPIDRLADRLCAG